MVNFIRYPIAARHIIPAVQRFNRNGIRTAVQGKTTPVIIRDLGVQHDPDTDFKIFSRVVRVFIPDDGIPGLPIRRISRKLNGLPDLYLLNLPDGGDEIGSISASRPRRFLQPAVYAQKAVGVAANIVFDFTLGDAELKRLYEQF